MPRGWARTKNRCRLDLKRSNFAAVASKGGEGGILKSIGGVAKPKAEILKFKDELNFKKCKRRSESKILKFQKRYKFKKTAAFD